MADARLSEAVAAATNTTTNTTSNLLVFLLPRVLSLTSALLGDSSGNATVLTREILDVAFKVFTLDGTSSTLGSLGINPVLLDFSNAMWPLYLITIPLLIGAIIWYFITTFVLGKNVLGRNVFSSKKRQEEETMDVLTKRVIWAFEEPKYT